MAIQSRGQRTLVFQNSNGIYYTLTFDPNSGVGVAKKHGAKIVTSPSASLSKTTVTVDAGSLAAWKGFHESRMIIEAVYNTGQTLDAILNAAS